MLSNAKHTSHVGVMVGNGLALGPIPPPDCAVEAETQAQVGSDPRRSDRACHDEECDVRPL